MNLSLRGDGSDSAIHRWNGTGDGDRLIVDNVLFMCLECVKGHLYIIFYCNFSIPSSYFDSSLNVASSGLVLRSPIYARRGGRGIILFFSLLVRCCNG